MDGKVVFEGKTEKGLDVLIRYVKAGDEQVMNEYINDLSKECTFISFQGEEISPDFEKEYVEKLLENFKAKLAVHLLVFTGNKLIGSADLHLKDPNRGAIKHTGTFGISIARDYRRKGLGKLLMKLVLDEALQNLPNLKIVTLRAFAANEFAIKMYKDFGFLEFGRLPEGLFRKGEYTEEVYMYKKVR